jgi:hypothetical protein
MRRISLAVALTTALLLAFSGPVAAIQFAQPDGERHPQVGIMVAFVDGTPAWRCTGTMISEHVFLTAGHCVSGSDHVEIWFGSTPAEQVGYPFTGEYSGEPIAHPEYDDFAAFPATYDIGVVILDTPFPGPYASLATVGTLDAMAKGSRKGDQFHLVGYGLQDALPPVFNNSRTRMFGTASLVNTKSANNAGYSVQLSASPGKGGALCFGDSGGPVFLAGTTTIVAVNSFVLNSQCMGAGFSYRTDTADSLAFIADNTP